MLLDYKTENLFVNGIEVNALTVVGKLVERMFVISKESGINFVGLSEQDLPSFVLLRMDGRDVEEQVRCHDADKSLAVQVGRVLRTKLQTIGLGVVGACVEVVLENRRVGEHDLICEIVGGIGAEQVRKYLSVELKLRTLYTDWGLGDVRQKQRKELCIELPWWTAKRDSFCGRLIVLGRFSAAPANKKESKDYKVTSLSWHGDLLMNNETDFRGIFGWGDARGEISWNAPPPPLPSRSPPQAKAKAAAAAVAKAKAKAKAVAKARAESGEALLRKLTFRQGVTELKELLTVANKGATNAAYWAQRARQAGFSRLEVYQQEQRHHTSSRGRKRQKLGGTGPWVLTAAACKYLLKEWGKH